MNKIVLAVSLIIALAVSPVAFSKDTTEVGKLKQRLMALEQKIYSGNTSSEGTMLADFEARLGGLEEEAQKVYGAVEELGHSVDEFAKKMDLIAKDLDLRLVDLESSIDKMKMQKMKPTRQKPKEPKSSAKAPKSKKSNKKIMNKKTEPKKMKASNVPDKISAEDLYSKAYHLLVATSYADAEVWMKAFIKRHPSHDLADNAHYWLGEIYLVQNKPEKAVVSFSTGLSKFPKGAKAAANLLKMGTAFKQMGKKDFAESSWGKLVKDYKDTPEAKKATKELDALKTDS